MTPLREADSLSLVVVHAPSSFHPCFLPGLPLQRSAVQEEFRWGPIGRFPELYSEAVYDHALRPMAAAAPRKSFPVVTPAFCRTYVANPSGFIPLLPSNFLARHEKCSGYLDI
ncbi:hypothetical protein KM043_012922 [Ampulex compressa]|nr:hypothetical protein KM043_012922 [Ampulex compressa]